MLISRMEQFLSPQECPILRGEGIVDGSGNPPVKRDVGGQGPQVVPVMGE